MKKAILSALGLILVIGIVYVVSEISSGRSYNLHYKMTVTVETPEGIKMGSVVREISNAVQPISLPDVGNSAGVTGEAVVVDLGERGVLFALISHESDEEFYNAFPIPKSGPTTAAGIKYYDTSLKLGMKAEITRGIPKMVTFTDMNDAKSVKLVRGYRYNAETQKNDLVDNFQKFFGEGVKLASVTVEITDEPVTWGVVDEWLPIGARKLNMTYNYFSQSKITKLK